MGKLVFSDNVTERTAGVSWQIADSVIQRQGLSLVCFSGGNSSEGKLAGFRCKLDSIELARGHGG